MDVRSVDVGSVEVRKMGTTGEDGGRNGTGGDLSSELQESGEKKEEGGRGLAIAGVRREYRTCKCKRGPYHDRCPFPLLSEGEGYLNR